MATKDSATVTTTLALQGVWLQDPMVGDQESARHFPYGSAAREESLDPMGEETFFAGRTDPVTNYGEHEAYAVGVTMDVPHGPTWAQDLEDLRAFAGSKRVIFFRDNRGRALYGVLESFRIRDAAWGSQVSFTVSRRDHAVTVVPA